MLRWVQSRNLKRFMVTLGIVVILVGFSYAVFRNSYGKEEFSAQHSAQSGKADVESISPPGAKEASEVPQDRKKLSANISQPAPVPANPANHSLAPQKPAPVMVKRSLRAEPVSEIDGNKVWTQKFHCDTTYSDGTINTISGGGNYKIQEGSHTTLGTVSPPDCPTYPTPTPQPPGVIPN